MSEFYERLFSGASADIERKPRGLVDTFKRGFQGTVQQTSADIDYFQALGQTLIGADEAAAKNIGSARFKEELAAAPLQGIESFSQFIDEPTIQGFFSQVAKGTGQLAPYAISSIVSAGVGGAAAAVGQGVMSTGSRAVAKRLIRDATEKALTGKASLDESVLAANAYRMFVGQQRELRKQAITRGALTGAGASEYVPLSGSNLSEALESGEELDRGTAFRAGAVALPQAVIGVGGEAVMAKALMNVAANRST